MNESRTAGAMQSQGISSSDNNSSGPTTPDKVDANDPNKTEKVTKLGRDIDLTDVTE